MWAASASVVVMSSSSLWLIVLLCCGDFFVFAGDVRRPNVLFIVVDDLRPALGCYGNRIMATPNIDSLAKKSVLFERAYAQQSSSGPSRTSFMTSRRPDTTRVYDSQSYCRTHAGNFTTLPQHFKQHGYFTRSVGKVFHPQKASNFTDDYTMSWSVPAYHPPSFTHTQAKVCPGEDGELHQNVVCPVTVSDMPDATLPDIQTSDYAIQFLHNRSQHQSPHNPPADQPFFLAVGFHKPHIPLVYPKEYLDLYPMSEIHLAPNPTYPLWLPQIAWHPWDDIRLYDDIKALNVSFPFGPMPPSFQLKLRQSYYAATSFMDAQVGKVLSALDVAGFADNTIIVFFGDNGLSLGEHQEWSKYTNFDVSSRVPLLFYVPSVTAPVSAPGHTFPFHDVFTMSSSPGAQALRAHSSFQPSEISSQMMTMLKKVVRKRRQALGLDDSTVNEAFSGKSIKQRSYPHNRFYSFSHPHQKKLVINRGWRQIFQGNVLPLVTRVNTAGRKKNSKASLKYRLSLHVDKRSKTNLHQMLSMQGAQSTQAIAELVDIFPTLAELAGLDVPPTCPPDPFDVALCTEGSSLVPVILNVTRSRRSTSDTADTSNASNVGIMSNVSVESDLTHWKKAAFTQTPRSSVNPERKSDQAYLRKISIMGYSMRTQLHRYTEWVAFDPHTFRANWSHVYAKELYLHETDSMEDKNVAYFPQYSDLVTVLSSQLRQGWRDALPW